MTVVESAAHTSSQYVADSSWSCFCQRLYLILQCALYKLYFRSIGLYRLVRQQLMLEIMSRTCHDLMTMTYLSRRMYSSVRFSSHVEDAAIAFLAGPRFEYEVLQFDLLSRLYLPLK